MALKNDLKWEDNGHYFRYTITFKICNDMSIFNEDISKDYSMRFICNEMIRDKELKATIDDIDTVGKIVYVAVPLMLGFYSVDKFVEISKNVYSEYELMKTAMKEDPRNAKLLYEMIFDTFKGEDDLNFYIFYEFHKDLIRRIDKMVKIQLSKYITMRPLKEINND